MECGDRIVLSNNAHFFIMGNRRNSNRITQDEVYQNFGGIDFEDIFQGRIYRVWPFSNEDLSALLELGPYDNKKVFSIAGSGDQAAVFLSKGAKNCSLCDTRDLACLFAEFKFSALKNLCPSEFKAIFGLDGGSGNNTFIYWKKIRKNLSSTSAYFFDRLFQKKANIYQTLKKSKLFYNEGWSLAKKRGLAYLDNLNFRKNFTMPLIINSSIITALKFSRTKFDLIYLSNVLDSRKYIEDPLGLLQGISKYLEQNGEVIIVTQDLKKTEKLLQESNYKIIKLIRPKKLFLQLFLPDYSYFYLKIHLPFIGEFFNKSKLG